MIHWTWLVVWAWIAFIVGFALAAVMSAGKRADGE